VTLTAVTLTVMTLTVVMVCPLRRIVAPTSLPLIPIAMICLHRRIGLTNAGPKSEPMVEHTVKVATINTEEPKNAVEVEKVAKRKNTVVGPKNKSFHPSPKHIIPMFYSYNVKINLNIIFSIHNIQYGNSNYRLKI
jgi:hypothetical protein